ncbi:MAG: hypothetical protein H6812_01835 [Phycisphaeraceae bacterium]|nr:hypothetical protein [Phycisphaerales bacterium]MCA9305131.1 hypothetical protein [Phycisphaerales bacterium]MCB9841977.1 hypothetical protein [Phycisphaeraceae bacterium]
MTNRCKSLTRSALLVLGGAAFVSAIGCASTGGDPHVSRFRSNPTPLLHTLGKTGVESSNRIALTHDHNGRALNSDMGRFLLTDRPSRLTPEPVAY